MTRFENRRSRRQYGTQSEVSGMSRRGLLRAGGAGAVGLAAATLGTGASRIAVAQDAGWQGEIVMFAQAYTPDSKLPDAVQLTAFREVADEYQKTHSGVTITYLDEDMPEYLQSVRVKAAGRELWDVFWGQASDLNGTLPRGIARDLKDAFAQPNPYIPEAATWQEAMNPTVLAITSDPSGARFNINGDYVGTAFFYNKDLFT